MTGRSNESPEGPYFPFDRKHGIATFHVPVGIRRGSQPPVANARAVRFVASFHGENITQVDVQTPRLRSPNAHVAQSVEHVLGKDEVTGSIPVMGSTNIVPHIKNQPKNQDGKRTVPA